MASVATVAQQVMRCRSSVRHRTDRSWPDPYSCVMDSIKIQERYGIATDEAEKQLSAWGSKAEDSWFS